MDEIERAALAQQAGEAAMDHYAERASAIWVVPAHIRGLGLTPGRIAAILLVAAGAEEREIDEMYR